MKTVHTVGMGGLFALSGIFIGIFLLFFPLYVETDFHYQLQDKKIGFAVYLCKHFKIIGGYLTEYAGGFALHTDRDKVRLLPINDQEGRKKRISIFRRFQISDFAITTETCAEYIPLTLGLHALCKTYYLYQGGEKNSYQSHVWLKNGDVFTVTINSVARINLYMQICAFFVFLKEKWKNARRKQKN